MSKMRSKNASLRKFHSIFTNSKNPSEEAKMHGSKFILLPLNKANTYYLIKPHSETTKKGFTTFTNSSHMAQKTKL
ncbi:MAG: hypothetical protein QMD82_07355 [bacterium]|nr:hypothetical protein [bacterium]